MSIKALGRSNVKSVKTICFLSFITFLLLFESSAIAQGGTLRGKITDTLGVPLQGVSVTVKNTTNGTSTNSAGDFTLNGVPSRSTIVVSNVGLETQEIQLTTGQTSLNLVMKVDVTSMQDVIVTGFQRIDKKKFTGAAITLKAQDIKIDGLVDVSRMLEGRAAGVSVQNVSSTFGSAPKVRVRGATSINGDNKPLWVVDGVVLEDIINISNDQLSSGDPTTLLGSSVAGINANDIETFDILKDAAATALYGARAMNGVVVITTKKGRSGKLAISYTGNFSTQLKPRYPEYNIMNSAQQMSVLGELERKGYLNSDILSRANYGVYGQMLNSLNADANGNFPLENTPEARKEFLLRYARANTDWFDLLFRNSLTQEHSLSISAGTEKSQSFFSTSFYHDNGWTIADNVKRYTLNFRNNYNFNDRLSAGFLTVGSVRQQRAPGTLNRTSNPVSGQFDREFDINPFSYALNTNRALTAYDQNGNLEYFRRNFAPFNIINELDNNYIDLNIIDLKLQGELGYKITKNLRYEFIGALRYVKSSREHQITENANMANAYRANENATMNRNNKFLYSDPDHPDDPRVVVLPYGGFYNRTEDQLLNFDVRNSLNYSNTIADRHDINVLVGQQVKYADRQNFSSTGYGYQYDNGGIPFIDYRILKQTIEANFPYYGMTKYYDRFAAFYLNAQYTLDKKYNFYGTVRYDGSNLLGSSPSARWLPTWSFGGSWNLEQEAFMEDIDFIDYMKLRASYGITASLGPATNSAIVLRSATTNRPYPDERESIINLINLENADLTWEKNYQANIGVDAGFFKNRLNVSVDGYSRRSFDLISRIKTSGIGGEAYKAANYADMESRGFEFLIGGQILRQKNLNWKTTLTFGYNQTEITNAQNVPLIFDLVKAEGGNRVGFPVNSLFSLKFQGLNPENGIPRFTDETGKVNEGVFLQDDNIDYLVYEGPVDPTITGGFSNTFDYKNLSLNVFITYQAGNKIRLYPAFRSSYVDLDAMPKEFFDRWEMRGDEKVTNVPAISDKYFDYITSASGAYPYNNYNYSDVRVVDGSFVRLKTVALTYRLGEAALKRLSVFKTFSLTAAASNFWLIYSDKKLKGQDPEFFNAGGVAQPIQKQITLSLKVGL
ncbi:SusC/RagA family TonB-linked outer membrane protein [Terrimonas pollutisoli]|uniref:SusC/RagA family TonB-linked outer membrane protein n=1 Tax=Terrimonas pollutisoli TaxID=3034147 RepID=UPI0023EAFF1A|nr:SusC/RagA family TonB-linked outer membrane protein [Terrimonas sp. H1YJ31]